ncbi:bifunctional phosphoribosylaminoimidazolecarboxamide formyltransferase/IMP cyclohydrolase [Acidithiobacillus ferriphilus]|jgi:phosphoribosylaminoimidazolecarboxamide formyltransferase/IMP cyclohydrolase|uniref:bifunctional phosphoribosylaminoimidazolecarboxamide formyltransferase/IMP cyclohydrolase n=1 Tax=Acidithiobacillus ferriphilus TaxID=1689834 RepID=UPI00232DF5D1|nr:bifunctional phosphoribosylaminoimidazolecarboxamide formyltransferase/IMP cyclohydrolase [Acidithiobacillus ferriphilus]WCE94700.1 bifunctional phosphoribosylaminoimidazolecarboxamide formyltransferase/IMP cyclohydrolase [Acidithiobacillus ferriphilus]
MGEITRALISVSDKRGVVEFARRLQDFGVEILSTGGTAKVLMADGVAVQEVSDYTSFPELLEGRLKTLHPKIHGGLLAKRGNSSHVRQMAEHGIPAIDLLCVNLYPFAETVASADCTLEEAIENIDIGGPTMLRAAAKNWENVTVLVDPDDYPAVLQEMEQSYGGIGASTRFRLATKVFAHTTQYDGAIANYLSRFNPDGSRTIFPQTLSLQFEKVQDLRYGENPHQTASFYRDGSGGGLANARQLQGKELSYNNIGDGDAAVALVMEFAEPACCVVKHGNPCGAAVGLDLLGAYQRAWAGDPVSAFGGIIACNRPLDAQTAELMSGQFVEMVLAPTISPDARPILAKKKNLRVLAFDDGRAWRRAGWDYKRVRGGLLVQDFDQSIEAEADWKVVSERAPTTQEARDLAFVWRVGKYVRSNAIVYGREGQTIGIGAGQMSRVDAARCGAAKALELGFDLHGAALASDAFFPFRDGVDAAAAAGVKVIIQPGGSIRDEEVIASANEHGIAMVFTGVRHFRHG